MQTPTPERKALISAHLGVSQAFSPEASALNDRFQDLMSDIGDLDPAEKARLLAGMIAQASAGLVRLHG